VVHVDAKGDATPHLDRVKTELDITALRLEIESSGSPAASTATASGASATMTPGAHIRRGRQELSAGQLDTADAEFRAALTTDPANASAHRGLGEVDRRRGKLDDAVKELQASLEASDSAFVRTMLAKVYLDQKKFDLAHAEAEHALKLAPNYAEAKQLLEHLQNAKPTGSPQ
jgi:tetratricopeptide (TPR) repeat protein